MARKKNGKREALLDRPLDRSRLRVEFNPAEQGVAPVSLEVLVPDAPLPADLYLPLVNRETQEVEMTLASRAGDVFLARWRDRLAKAGQRQVFLKLEEAGQLVDYFQEHAPAIVDSPDSTLRKKAMVVREMASLNLRVLFGGDLSPRAVEGAVGRAHDTVSRLASNPMILSNLAEVVKSDYSVYTHSVNVCMLAMAFGRYLAMSEGQVAALGMGGLLHDVGMSRMPPAILEKPGPLTPAERQTMNQHPRRGYQMLLPIGAVPYDVLMIVLHHHENADGTGYPDHVPAERTPRLARLVKVCDAFDAMTSQRPYQDARPAYDAAKTLIQDMSSMFGPDLVPTFIRFLGSPFFSQ
jgi:HD-GYP domain-containing protein (c-di-GMP phosphodiesterase class II)